MSFSAAEENFHQAARLGIDAQLFWPGLGYLPATELVLRRLLPMAAEGLDRWDVAPAERDRLLEVIRRRCLSGANGASWQADTVRGLEECHGLPREQALRTMLSAYVERMHSNVAVDLWD
jgi:hypothetical protein